MHTAADLTSQANHRSHDSSRYHQEAELPERNGGYPAVEKDGTSCGKTSKLVYEKHHRKIDLVRYQVANCYMGAAV